MREPNKQSYEENTHAAGVYAGTPWMEQGIAQWEQDTKEKLKELAAQLKTKINGLEANVYKPTIDTYISLTWHKKKASHFCKAFRALVGIRTPNLLIRSEMLYPIELQMRFRLIGLQK